MRDCRQDSNTFGAHESWRNPLGTAVGQHGVEDDRTVETMPRQRAKGKASVGTKHPPQVLLWASLPVHLESRSHSQDANAQKLVDIATKDGAEKEGEDTWHAPRMIVASTAVMILGI